MKIITEHLERNRMLRGIKTLKVNEDGKWMKIEAHWQMNGVKEHRWTPLP